ncbi:YqjD family protein [Mesorhizobium calcicola]|uniref:YqjD family protein n=1 Tax=Mesorhizobium calcicola TaxID=1300310 RepID=A0ABW4WM23_9HYPH
MATAAGKAANEGRSNSDLEADIRQLKADIDKLTKQLAKTGEHGYGTARRAATEGVEQLRAQGEAAFDNLRSNAKDIEAQMMASVREKPVTSLAIAAGVGFLFALLARR